MSLLQQYQERERKLLATEYDGRSVYCLDRAWLSYLASPIIEQYTFSNPQILEIGCGNGRSITAILENNKNVSPSDITGTSLDYLPGHTELLRMGVKIATDVIAEDLPSNWTNTFDIVMACVVMEWTNLEQSVPSVLKTIKSGGYFIGYDTLPVTTSIESLAKKHAKVSSLRGNPEEIQHHHAFVIKKH